jgi:hypothetical protein
MYRQVALAICVVEFSIPLKKCSKLSKTSKIYFMQSNSGLKCELSICCLRSTRNVTQRMPRKNCILKSRRMKLEKLLEVWYDVFVCHDERFCCLTYPTSNVLDDRGSQRWKQRVPKKDEYEYFGVSP